MNTSHKYIGTCAIALTAMLSVSAAQAQEVPVVREGNVAFVTGGVGEEERSAMNEMQDQYNLHIMSSRVSGEYLGDTHINIKNRRGQEILSTDAGPLFYAKIPPGTYTVEATDEDGVTHKKTVGVGPNRSSNLHFSWK